MKILLTNDDGIFCEALGLLYEELIKLGDVKVVAPLEGQSGASHSLSLSPIVCEKASVDGLFSGWAVSGSPADCVKLAVLELYGKDFDLIVSGMNIGANVGIDMLYSGTLAAAIEGGFYGIPAIAISSKIGQKSMKNAAVEGIRAMTKMLEIIKPGDIININVPILKRGKSKGIKFVPQAEAIYEEKYTKGFNEDGKLTYKIASENHKDAKPNTDRHALSEGYTTITPVSYAMTNYSRLEKINLTMSGSTF